MRARNAALFFIGIMLAWGASSFVAHAEIVTMYTQPDGLGEMLSQQPTFQTAWIESASLGNLILGKDCLSITFTMKDPNAGNVYHTPTGVALETCSGCQNLQTYYFTDADRTLLADGAYHTFTVETGTTTSGTADGETPIYLTFFGLSQYHLETHVTSNADGTIPQLLITGTPPSPVEVPQAPEGSVTIYTQDDKSGVMTNPQMTFLNAYVDSASLGNLNLGQGKLYITFTIKDPDADNAHHTPEGICLQEASSTDCNGNASLQTYYFTDADRTLLADGAFHTFMVETGTTTSTYADGTRPVSIGFFGLSQYQYGTKIKSNAEGTIPFLTIKTPPPLSDPCIAAGTCVSNVLFLPGIEGSRLYEGIGVGCDKTAGEKLWEPFESFWSAIRGVGDSKVRGLFLNDAGESVCSDVYAKADDIIDSAGGGNIYKSFIDEMNGLKTDGTITDWKAVAYDWRLSLDDLLNKGKEQDGKIYYEDATNTPYILQTLRALAAASKTGKVTIVAHSNGGLLAKALLNQLGGETAKLLVDKVIMVGAPQSGAPIDVGALLYGLDQGISSWGISILHSDVAQSLAKNSPMAYHLLPSQNYLNSVASDANHPVARFAGDAYATEKAAYGTTITSISALDNFLLASSLNSSLVDYANREHGALDSWVPPAGIEVDQIAGWGADTVAGIDFYTLSGLSALSSFEPVRMYRPIFTENGDGTVPVPSALMMSTSTENVKRYWLNLDSYRKDTSIKRSHKDIFEIPSLGDFIRNLIENSTSTLPAYISTNQPSALTNDKKLTFFLHSPLTLLLADSFGNITGLSEDGSINQDIPDSTYGEFGDVKYVTVPEGNNYQLIMNGQESGTFSLDIQESSGGVVTNLSTIANVPTTGNTLATLTISNGIDTASALTVDENDDGTNVITLTPVVGEIVNYAPPAPPPAPEPTPNLTLAPALAPTPQIIPPSPGGISIPVITPIQVVPNIATTTSIVAISPRLIAIRSIPKRSPSPAVTVANTMPNLSQTSSVYGASQQPVFTRLGMAFYNGLYAFWSALKKFF